MADPTVSLLSQIETGKTHPSLGALIAIARVLNASVGSFFDFAEQPARLVVRFGSAGELHRSDVDYYLFTPDGSNRPASVVICKYSPGAAHDGMECGLILGGKLEVLIKRIYTF